MKYKELPAFETNEFKKEDLVHIYHSLNDVKLTEWIHGPQKVSKLEKDYVFFDGPFGYHFKQCRKLEEIKPREFYVKEVSISYTISTSDSPKLGWNMSSIESKNITNNFIEISEIPKEGYIKVREVIE